MRDHKMSLQQQMETNKKNQYGMDQKEYLLNKQILETIEKKAVSPQ